MVTYSKVSHPSIEPHNQRRPRKPSALEPTTMAPKRSSFHDLFDCQDVIGEGGFAIVYRARSRRNHQTYAVKDATGNHDELQNEITNLLMFSACNLIVDLYKVYYEEQHTYLVMEEMKGGDLLSRILEKTFYTEPEARQVCRNLLEAVDYCHKLNVAHRDLKPENVLLVEKGNDVNIKLADFGLATRVDRPNCLKTLCGTTEYTAPEVFSSNGYDQRADMWSIGVILYILLCGYEPFEGPLEELLLSIQHGAYEFHEDTWGGISDSAKALIRSLMNVDANKRLTAREALESQWISKQERRLSIKDLCRKFERCDTVDATKSIPLPNIFTSPSLSARRRRIACYNPAAGGRH